MPVERSKGLSVLISELMPDMLVLGTSQTLAIQKRQVNYLTRVTLQTLRSVEQNYSRDMTSLWLESPLPKTEKGKETRGLKIRLELCYGWKRSCCLSLHQHQNHKQKSVIYQHNISSKLFLLMNIKLKT